jgi:hypothetical protein
VWTGQKGLCMNSERTKHIEDAVSALVRDCFSMDWRTLGENVDFFSYDPLIAEQFTRLHTIPMIDAVEKQAIEPKEIGRLLHNPSAMRSMYIFDMLMAKCARAGIPVYQRIFDFYNDALAAICTEDHFAKNFNNKIHSEKEIARHIKNCTPANRDLARALGKLANACYSFSHAAYSDMNPQLVYDNFGPYYRKNGKLFALKIFHNLRPIEIWPETEAIPVSKINVGVVLAGVTMKVDSITHAIYEGNQVDCMVAWFAEADGRALSLKEIDLLRERLEDMAVMIHEKVKKSDTATKKERYCYQKCWGYKALFDRLGLDWRPHEEVLDAMKGDHLFDRWNIPKAKQAKIMAAILDPRVEIPEGAIRPSAGV